MVGPHDELVGSETGAPLPVTSSVTDQLFGLTEALPTTGRHAGFIKIPHSSDQSAYGFVPVPLAVIGGGDGATILLLAGVFGDEVDAQIALARVAQLLDPTKMNGRVLVMTMANTPASLVGTRISPLDQRNLNKSFPGNVFGTPTSMIADYIERHLMPISDIVLDLHSDGRSLRYLPIATMIEHADPDLQLRRMAIVKAFGAPNILVFKSFEDRSTSGAARRAGAVRVGTEIGGPSPVQTIVDGVMRVLHWAGVVASATPADSQGQIYLARRDEDFVYAVQDGVFEPGCRLGDIVAAGDVAGHIHDLTRPLSSPQAVRFTVDGTVVCTRGAGLTRRGDCLMHLAVTADAEALAQFEEAASLRWLPNQTRRRLKKSSPAKSGRGRP